MLSFMQNHAGEKICILIVDDEPEIVDYLVSVLVVRGYECLTAYSEDEALAVLANCPPERSPLIAIIDLVLGDRNGIKTAGALVQTHPTMDVLLISGYADTIVSTALPNGRIAAFLTKPFSTTDLIGALKSFRRV